jgi:hypothetical protein
MSNRLSLYQALHDRKPAVWEPYQGRTPQNVEDSDQSAMWCAILLGLFVTLAIVSAWVQIGSMIIDWLVL